VFRARDTRLNRDVALKILPDAFASDAERVARFTREAQTLAALNHPHIAQIYGVEIGAGEGSGPGCRALVMELVEGEDLSERLSRGPLPIDEALPIARQIAEALEAAHEQGIIHRDLKPGNIKLRPDGTVKVLDFGLAKALDHAPVSGSQASPVQQSPTITTPAMTGQGVILGTAAYMSPEQAKGRVADQRSDVWAFGCVLFEMLTARRAFDGEDVSDTLAAVLRGDPPYAALPAETPPVVVTLIKRCLERDRRRRVASVSTALFVIDEASAIGAAAQQRARPDDGTIRSQVQAAVSEARRTLIRKRFVPVVAALLLLAVTAGIVAWRFRPTRSTLVTRFTLPVAQTGLVTGGLGRSVIAVSNDGATLAYVANRELLLRPVSDFAARAIPTTDAVGAGLIHSLVFSPDDQSLAFFATISGTVKRISLSGGAAITVCTARQPWGMTWHETGLIIAQGPDGIVRCAANGGAPEQLVTVSADELAQGPQIIAEDTLLFTLAKPSDGAEMWDKAEIVVQSLASGARKTILRGTDARYVPTGHLLYAVSGVVFAIPFDARRQEVSGAAVPVIEGVRRSVGNTGTAHFVTSPTGSLIYFPGPVGSTVATWGVAVADRTGAPTRLPVQPGPYSHVRASRDGSYLAVGSDDNREAIVWIHRLDGNSAMRRLTLTGRNRFPVWLPDGQRVAFQSDREGDAGIFVQRIDGTGAAERLTKAAPGETHIPDAWSPDGRYMLFAVRKGADYSLGMFSIRGSRQCRGKRNVSEHVRAERRDQLVRGVARARPNAVTRAC
jgi:eukaryotic-like serine/threonine-protein kinase